MILSLTELNIVLVVVLQGNSNPGSRKWKIAGNKERYYTEIIDREMTGWRDLT